MISVIRQVRLLQLESHITEKFWLVLIRPSKVNFKSHPVNEKINVRYCLQFLFDLNNF